MSFCPLLPEVGCPKFKEIRRPWGKVMEKRGLRCKPFFLKNGLILLRQKKVFLMDFFLPFFTPYKCIVDALPKVQCPNFKIFRIPGEN